MDKNKRRKEWEAALDLMTEEELDFITEHPVGYYPSFYEMARMKQMEMMDDPYAISEPQAMMNAIIHIIEELGCQCIVYEDDELCFYCQGASFSVFFDKQYDYIDIVDRSWKMVQLNNIEKVENMRFAINRANVLNSVTISYIIDSEEGVMELHSSSNIPYFPNMAYLQKTLKNKLCEMLSTHDLVAYYLQKAEDYSLEEAFSQIDTNETN